MAFNTEEKRSTKKDMAENFCCMDEVFKELVYCDDALNDLKKSLKLHLSHRAQEVSSDLKENVSHNEDIAKDLIRLLSIEIQHIGSILKVENDANVKDAYGRNKELAGEISHLKVIIDKENKCHELELGMERIIHEKKMKGMQDELGSSKERIKAAEEKNNKLEEELSRLKIKEVNQELKEMNRQEQELENKHSMDEEEKKEMQDERKTLKQEIIRLEILLKEYPIRVEAEEKIKEENESLKKEIIRLKGSTQTANDSIKGEAKTGPKCKGQGAVMETRQIGPGVITQMQNSLDTIIDKGIKNNKKVVFRGVTDDQPNMETGDMSNSPPLAQMLNFNDLAGDGNLLIPDDYFGFNCKNLRVKRSSCSTSPGFKSGCISPPNVAFNDGGGPVLISSVRGLTFTVHSLFVAAARKCPLTVRFEGFSSNGTVSSQTVYLASPKDVKKVALNKRFTALSTFKIITSPQNNIVLDNIAIAHDA